MTTLSLLKANYATRGILSCPARTNLERIRILIIDADRTLDNLKELWLVENTAAILKGADVFAFRRVISAIALLLLGVVISENLTVRLEDVANPT